MPGQMREFACAVDMQPASFARDAHPGCIGVLQWTSTQPVGNPSHRGSESLCCQFDPRHQRSLRQLATVQIAEQFAHSPERD
jgi:hypothetical protein